ncbi:MAG: DUF3727 domain-containing protein [Cyanobacteria bacterium]|nr:DUF3727 domain-containing protein [Cyanobacteriota bacterium]MDA0865883.1 DUF3727 domain-containing protein [Cyanobacteriota bacterium]
MTAASEFAQEDSTVTLRDETGRSLSCQVEQTFEVDDAMFGLLLPIDTPIEVFAWSKEEGVEDDDDETLVDVEDEEIEVLFPTAYAVLAEQNLTLQKTAVTLTVAGELPDVDEEDCFTLEINDLLSQEDEATSEDFQILATFFHEDVEYTICTPVDPLLIFARLLSDGTAQVVPPEEFELLRPDIESALFEVLD